MYCLFRVLFPPPFPSKQIVDVHVAPRPISAEGRGLAKFVKCNVAAATKDLRSFARSFSSV